MKAEIKLVDGKLNIDLKVGDKILVERENRRKGYIFNGISPFKEYRLKNVKTGDNVTVGINWFVIDKKSYLWEDDNE